MTTSASRRSPALRAQRSRLSGELGRYILVRFFLIIPTVFILVTMVFFLIRLTGDPITAALGGRLPADQLQERIHEAGYDRPIIVQYVEYLGQVFTGNFGTTLTDNRPVTEVLLTYGSATLELVIYALIVALIVGIPLGLVAAATRDRCPDAGLRVSAILFYATPVFFAGLVLEAHLLGLARLVSGERSRERAHRDSLLAAREPHRHLPHRRHRLGQPGYVQDVLCTPSFRRWRSVCSPPASSCVSSAPTSSARTTCPTSTPARSRGVSEYRLVRKHAYKPALIPIITVIGLQIALLLGGAVLTETTFEWQGLGFQLAEVPRRRATSSPCRASSRCIAIIVALTNFLVDVIAAFLDPRVRY